MDEYSAFSAACSLWAFFKIVPQKYFESLRILKNSLGSFVKYLLASQLISLIFKTHKLDAILCRGKSHSLDQKIKTVLDI